MSKVTFHIAMSLDGYVAGPDQTRQEPLGRDGERLHDWFVELAAFYNNPAGKVNESTPVVQAWTQNLGAYIMGRNMFGPPEGGDWTEPWSGWWGEEPPYHLPVFVLTHHPREPLEMKGGTTFHFVTEGVDAAVARAREAAGDRDILVAGGASVINQLLAAGHIDEFEVSVVPLFLGGGERLFAGLGADLPRLEQLRTVGAPGVTHLRYRVISDPRD